MPEARLERTRQANREINCEHEWRVIMEKSIFNSECKECVKCKMIVVLNNAQ